MTGSRALLLAAALALAVGLLFRFELYPVAPGMDAPYYHAFNWAAERQLRFGDDFISTYGPFGHLIITAPLGGLWKARLWFEGWIVLGAALVATAYVSSAPSVGPRARFGFVALLLYAVALQEAEYRVFALVVLGLLLSLHTKGRTAWLASAAVGLLAGFCLLIRVSLGFGCVGALVVGSLLSGSLGRRLARLAVGVGAAGVGCVLGWLASVGDPSSLAGYLATGIELASGYSSAVSHAPSDWWRGALAFAAWVVWVGGWILVQGNSRIRISGAALAVPTFIAWKHAMVRQDPNHVYFLVSFGLFVLAVLLVDAWQTRPRWSHGLVLGLACVLLAFTSVSHWTKGTESLHTVAVRVARPLAFEGVRALRELVDLETYRRDVLALSEELLRPVRLPASMRERIGAGTVDVYPWDSAYVWANGLDWRPRPLPATFSTVTPGLDQRNARFFESPGRPQFVLWHAAGVWSFDGRHVFWDEPLTLRAILGGYDEARTEAGLLLLRARENSRFPALETLGDATVGWGRWLRVPRAAGVVFAAATLERTLAARAVRVLFREDPVFLSLRFATGEAVRYRFAPDHAASGLWVSPFPVTGQEVSSLLRGGPVGQVVAIRFEQSAGVELSSGIRVRWLAMAPAADRFSRPPLAFPVAEQGRACAGAIEKVRSGTDWHGGTALSAIGWVRDEAAAPGDLDLWLTDGEGRALATETSVLPRPGATGWWAIARAEPIPEEIGFVLRDRDGGWAASCNRIRAPR
jgi:hypothetical protein